MISKTASDQTDFCWDRRFVCLIGIRFTFTGNKKFLRSLITSCMVICDKSFWPLQENHCSAVLTRHHSSTRICQCRWWATPGWFRGTRPSCSCSAYLEVILELRVHISMIILNLSVTALIQPPEMSFIVTCPHRCSNSFFHYHGLRNGGPKTKKWKYIHMLALWTYCAYICFMWHSSLDKIHHRDISVQLNILIKYVDTLDNTVHANIEHLNI